MGWANENVLAGLGLLDPKFLFGAFPGQDPGIARIGLGICPNISF